MPPVEGLWRSLRAVSPSPWLMWHLGTQPRDFRQRGACESRATVKRPQQDPVSERQVIVCALAARSRRRACERISHQKTVAMRMGRADAGSAAEQIRSPSHRSKRVYVGGDLTLAHPRWQADFITGPHPCSRACKSLPSRYHLCRRYFWTILGASYYLASGLYAWNELHN